MDFPVVRAKSTWSSHATLTRSLGQLVFCVDTGRCTCGTLVDKEKGSSQTGRRGQTVDVFCSCQKLTVFLDDGVPGLATSSQGSPAHFSETNLTRRGQVMGEPTLGTFCIQASLVPFLQLKASVLVLFCQAVLITWDFPSLIS